MNIQELPFEMVEKILSYLDTSKKTTFDQNLHLVCKKFFDACKSLEILKLNQGSPSIIKATNHPLAREIKAGDEDIKKLIINSKMDVEEIGKFFIKNKGIKDLKISTRVSNEFDLDYLLLKLKHLPLIENIDIKFHSDIVYENNFHNQLKDRIINKIIDSCPKIKKFSLFVYDGEISIEAFEAFSKLKKLEVLKLKNISLPQNFDGVFRNNFPQLKKINMSFQLNPIIINSLFVNAPNIVSCNIRRSEFGVNEINADIRHNLKKLQVFSSFRSIVDEGLFNLEEIHFFYGVELGEYCERFQDFPNLRHITIELLEIDGINGYEEIQDFNFVNDVTLTLLNYNDDHIDACLDNKALDLILLNDKIKHLELVNCCFIFNLENVNTVEKNSLNTISIKGTHDHIVHNIQFLESYNLSRLIKSISLIDEPMDEPSIEFINEIGKCRGLEKLSINDKELVLEGKSEIFSYLVDQRNMRGYDVDGIYQIFIKRICFYKYPIIDLLDFISDNQIEDKIYELNLHREIDGFEDRFLKLPNLRLLSFFDYDYYDSREEVLKFLIGRLPKTSNMIGKRKVLENAENSQPKKKK